MHVYVHGVFYIMINYIEAFFVVPKENQEAQELTKFLNLSEPAVFQFLPVSLSLRATKTISLYR